jgi:hypothetical protein
MPANAIINCFLPIPFSSTLRRKETKEFLDRFDEKLVNINIESLNECALKNTHVIQIKMNVLKIPAKLNLFKNAVVFGRIFCINCLKITSTHNKKPFKNPQITKFQLAPCHNPLIEKVTNKLKHLRTNDTRLPPIGMNT